MPELKIRKLPLCFFKGKSSPKLFLANQRNVSAAKLIFPAASIQHCSCIAVCTECAFYQWRTQCANSTQPARPKLYYEAAAQKNPTAGSFVCFFCSPLALLTPPPPAAISQGWEGAFQDITFHSPSRENEGGSKCTLKLLVLVAKISELSPTDRTHFKRRRN